jgi:hypothetical protein
MANVLFDKTPRYPPAGSLREAVFLHVWLKRQALEVEKVKLVAHGLVNKDNAEHLVAAYEGVIEKLFPFLAGTKKVTDDKMKEALKQEVAQGKIPFRVLESPGASLLKKRAQKISAPDELLEKLAEGVKKRRGLKR